MYKLIACDLDETLISLDRSITKENINAIKRCIDNGIKFVPSTGRGYLTVDNTLKQLGLYDLKNQYVISFNGGCISENNNHNILYFNGIGFNKASVLYKLGLNYDLCLHVYTKDKIYVYNYTDDERKYIANRMEMIEIFDDNIDFLINEEISKCCFENTDITYLKEFEKVVKQELNDLEITYSSNRYIEFTNKNVNKGSGLKKLAELLNIESKDIIAIGDNYNDLDMIKYAGLGAAVKNMPEELKKNCDYISNKDCDNSAVAEIINKFIFDEIN